MKSKFTKSLLIGILAIALLAVGAEVIYQLRPESQKLTAPEQAVIANPTGNQNSEQGNELVATRIVPSVEPKSTPTKSIISEQHNENVSVSLDWAVADERQIILQFTVKGYELIDGVQYPLEEMFKIIDENGKDIFSYSGYSGKIDVLNEDSFAFRHNFNGDYRSDPTGNLDLLASIQLGGFDASYISPTITFVPGPIPTETVHIPNAGNFEIPFSVTIQKGTEIEVNQSVVVNNIELRLERVNINPTGIEALICFQMPSSADWQLTATTITTGDGQVFHVRRSRVVGIKSSISNSESQRCNLVSFVTPYDMRTENFSISVPKLVTSATMTEESIQSANQKLSSKGISFDIVQSGHGIDYDVFQKPDGMSDEELYTLIWDSLRTDYPGPWEFSIGE